MSVSKSQAAVGLGSNLGDKAAHIRAALERLAEADDLDVVRVSRFYRTAPVGVTDQDWFVNAAAIVETGRPPRGLLDLLLSIEGEMGRVRRERWGPRIIDLDLLFYDDRVVAEEGLTLPHPRLSRRRFVLRPLTETAPEWRHPETGLTPAQMLGRIDPGDQEVEPLWA